MARISGVDIPREKRLVISLTYIYGVGLSRSEEICEATASIVHRVRDLTDRRGQPTSRLHRREPQGRG